jgi:hypothetical protein
MNQVRPPPRPRIYEYVIAEVLRPVVGIEATRAELESLPPPANDAAATILYLRAQLPVLALSGANRLLDATITEARRLSRSACAPALGWIADWAAAAQTTGTDPVGSLQRARAATTSLARYGETYTAARLLSEFLALMVPASEAELAQKTAQQLTHMGALASAARSGAVLTQAAIEQQPTPPSS